ncbi:Cysteine protease atg4 [Kalmusia sp. IMI 367209]|nr:Cysteine protease atg4 [Kalmusia sp. IMI 367209]
MNEFERVGRTILRSVYDPLPSNNSNEPIWCLGRRYDPKTPLPKPADTSAETPLTPSPAPQTERTGGIEDESWIRTSADESGGKEAANGGEDPDQYGGWPQPFLDDFESRAWMTYRSGFTPIQKSQDRKAAAAMSFRVRMQNLAQSAFTSDSGFGCMIRSGQCILANALLELRLGRGRLQDSRAEQRDRPVLSLFADDPKAPFSVHRFVEHGAAECGKYPGEWFGPSATARCIQDLVKNYPSAGLRVYNSGDGADIYEDKLREVAVDDDGKFQPTLILVGTRLGIEKITPVYWEALKTSLQLKQSVGIAGGRPSASHYFVGIQGNHFFYLDPHFSRPLLPYHEDPSAYSAEDIATCHTRRLRRIEIREMDPSMLIAFLIRDDKDFEDWKEGIVSVQGKVIVHVSKSQPPPRGQEREGAIEEVESFDEDGLQ